MYWWFWCKYELNLPGDGEGSWGRRNDLRPRPFLISSRRDSIRDSHSDTGVLHILLPPGIQDFSYHWSFLTNNFKSYFRILKIFTPEFINRAWTNQSAKPFQRSSTWTLACINLRVYLSIFKKRIGLYVPPVLILQVARSLARLLAAACSSFARRRSLSLTAERNFAQNRTNVCKGMWDSL